MHSAEKKVSFLSSIFNYCLFPKVFWFDIITISGSLLVIMESKHEEDQETYDKRTAKIQHNIEVSKEVEQNPSSDQPSTPLPPYR